MKVAPGFLRQHRQQSELDLGQREQLAAAGDPVGVQIDLQVVDAEYVRRLHAAAHPAQHGANTRHQFAGRERFNHIVVRTQLQPDQAVGLVRACGEHDDRHVGGAAQRPANVQAVHAGEVQIQNDQIGPFVARLATAVVPSAAVTTR